MPPPHLRSAESVESAGILDEFPGSLGLLLWQCTRDVAAWGLTPHPERATLFSADAEHRRLAALILLDVQVREVEQPIRSLARMLSRAQDTDAEVVLVACQAISQWAEAREAQHTALAFAQAAALAAPGSARACLRVGQLVRRRAEYARAEQWLQRAALLARQNAEREVHAWAYTALGYTCFLRGNMPAAQRAHQRALRLAERWELRARRAAALHDLFSVHVELGRFSEADGFARRAVAAYGPDHPSLPMLANDVAVSWIERGMFSHAAPVLAALVGRFSGALRALALTNFARAAGGAGDRDTFERIWTEALRSARQTDAEQRAAALLNLARGAVSLGERARADAVAREALCVAEANSESKVVFAAESLLAEIAALTAPAAPVEKEHEPVDALVDELVECLAAAGA